MENSAPVQLSLPFVELDSPERGMRVGYGKDCSVCTSPYRTRIDALLHQKSLSLKEIEQRAKEIAPKLECTSEELNDHSRIHGLVIHGTDLMADSADETKSGESITQTRPDFSDTQPIDTRGALDHLIRFGIGQLEMQQVKPSIGDITRAILAKEDMLAKDQSGDDIDLFLRAAKSYEAEYGVSEGVNNRRGAGPVSATC